MGQACCTEVPHDDEEEEVGMLKTQINLEYEQRVQVENRYKQLESHCQLLERQSQFWEGCYQLEKRRRCEETENIHKFLAASDVLADQILASDLNKRWLDDSVEREYIKQIVAHVQAELTNLQNARQILEAQNIDEPNAALPCLDSPPLRLQP